MELLIGCGHSREKRVKFPEIPEEWAELVTLDIDESVEPHVLHNLDMLPYPFDDNQFDEIHAYEVLEHCGTQGDYRFFFQQFEEFHRILKPGGWFIGSCPSWDAEWAWADPGHRRILTPKTFMFLSQVNYEGCGQPGNAMADYRFCYQADFELYHADEKPDTGQWYWIMRAIK